jgi:hypothetical protein
MPKFAEQIRNLIMNAGAAWTETNPALNDIFFPWKVSQDFLTHEARTGSQRSMIWTVKDRTEPGEYEGRADSEMRCNVNVFCYARAINSSEDAVKDAERRAENMRDQVAAIIKANWTSLSGGASSMRPNGDFQMHSFNVTPALFIQVLRVLVIYNG